MIVHLCSDNSFIDYCVIDTFNKLSSNNIYIVISINKKLSYIKQKDQVLILDPSDIKILNLCNNASAVIVHGMTREKSVWISSINKNVNILWSCFGADFYGLKEFKAKNYNLYEKATLEINNKNKTSFYFSKLKYRFLFIFLTYFKLRKSYPPLLKNLEKAFNRIDYIATVMPNEYPLIKKTISSLRNPKYLDFSYGDLNFLLGPFYKKEYQLGNKIIVGNSCSLTNNHIDAFMHIKAKGITNTILCPLSYGNETIKAIIISKGNEIFKDNFKYLDKFIPLDQYIKIIISCNVMIMNHRRQEAVGNILLGLYLGMRVFINSKSPVYSFLKEKSIIIYGFYDDFENTTACLSPLKKSEHDHNKKIIENIWGDSTVKKKILSTIKTLT